MLGANTAQGEEAEAQLPLEPLSMGEVAEDEMHGGHAREAFRGQGPMGEAAHIAQAVPQLQDDSDLAGS